MRVSDKVYFPDVEVGFGSIEEGLELGFKKHAAAKGTCEPTKVI